MSTVLENHFDPNYEPKREEIEEYGKWLGMELPKHEPLLWIARDGLKAPLPESWKACKSEKGELYYFNFKSGQSMWDHPMDSHFKELFKKEAAALEERLAGGGAAPEVSSASEADVGGSSDSATVEPATKAAPTAVAAPVELAEKPAKKKKDKEKRKQRLISFVESSPADVSGGDSDAAPELLPPKADNKAVPEASKGAAPKAAADTEPQQQPTPGSGMGKLAQLKNLKGGPAIQRRSSPLPKPAITAPAALQPAAETGNSNSRQLGPLKEASRSPATINAVDSLASSRESSPARPAAQPTPKALQQQPQSQPQQQQQPQASPSNRDDQKALQAARADQKQELERGLQAHKTALAAMRRAHEEEIKRLQDAHAARKGELVAAQKAEVSKLESDLQRLQARHTTDLTQRQAALKKQAEAELAALEKKLRADATEKADRMRRDAAQYDQPAAELRAAVVSAAASLPALLSECRAALSSAEDEFERALGSTLIAERVERVNNAVREATESRFHTELRQAETDAQSKLAATKTRCAEQLEELTAAHAAKVAELARTTTEMTSAIERIRGERDATVAAAQTEGRDVAAKTKAQHDEELRGMTERHTAAIAQLRAEHEAHLADVRKELLQEYAAAEVALRSKARAELDGMLAGASGSASLPGQGKGSASTDANGRGSALGSTADSHNGESESTETSLGSAGRGATPPSRPAGLSMSADALAQAAEAYMHGPLSVSSTETSPQAPADRKAGEAAPPLAPLGATPGALTGDALRTAIMAVLTDLASSRPAPEQEPARPAEEEPVELRATMPPVTDAATAMSPQATAARAVDRTPPAQSLDPESRHVDVGISPIHPVAAHHRPVPPRIPVSVQEQRRLVHAERQRLERQKAFLEQQEDAAGRHRAALKSARSKWKQDVRAAKAAGTSSSSRRAAVLRNVHAMLDQEAEGLAQDEAVLRDTRSWLEVREERLRRLEASLQQNEEPNLNDSAATSATAVETTAMLAAYLDLAPPLPAHPPMAPATHTSPRKSIASELGHAPPALHSRRRRANSGRTHAYADPSDGASLFPRDVNRDSGSRKASPLMGGVRPSEPGRRERTSSRSATPAPEVVDRLMLIESQLAEVTSLVRSVGEPRASNANSRSASAGGASRTGRAQVGFAADTRY